MSMAVVLVVGGALLAAWAPADPMLRIVGVCCGALLAGLLGTLVGRERRRARGSLLAIAWALGASGVSSVRLVAAALPVLGPLHAVPLLCLLLPIQVLVIGSLGVAAAGIAAARDPHSLATPTDDRAVAAVR